MFGDGFLMDLSTIPHKTRASYNADLLLSYMLHNILQDFALFIVIAYEFRRESVAVLLYIPAHEQPSLDRSIEYVHVGGLYM